MAQNGMQGLRLGRSFWWFFTFIAFLMVGLSGCGDVTSKPGVDPPSLDMPKATIFVANSGDGSLIAFDPSQSELILTGTVDVENGNDDVTGTGTFFKKQGLVSGDRIQIGGVSVTVLTVNTDTSLTLTSPFPGPTVSGVKAFLLDRNTLPQIPEGNISPTRRFPQSIVEPTGLFLDKTSDTLYVADANGNAIHIFENVSTQNPALGSAVPTRSISGPNTRLNHPFGVTFDATRGQLYVANRDSNSVLRFQANCPGTDPLDGDIAPCGVLIGGDTTFSFPTIPGVDTQIFFPRDIAVDSVRDVLYVSNVGNDSILVYDNASSVGGSSAACNPDPAACNIPPDRMITPHNDLNELETILDVPFGIFIDETNNRLYVVNTGFNLPGILIYENASTRHGGVIPERVWMSGNTALPPECSPLPNPPPGLPFPPECNNSQLSLPVGIDVDVANDLMYIANNNNTNNINLTTSANIDSTALLVFSLKDDNGNERCTIPTHICKNIPPDRRLGGDVTPDATSLTNPVGVAVDPGRGVIYLSNPLASNLLTFSLDGNINPFKVNSGDRIDSDVTFLEQPAGFFHDSALDRLFIANFTATKRPQNQQITVFDQISNTSFSNTAPTWSLQDLTNIASPRGVFTDSTRLLILSASDVSTKNGLLVYPPVDFTFFPKGSTITLSGPTILNNGLTQGGPPAIAVDSGPTAMAVDKGRDLVYVADQGDAVTSERIIVYDLTNVDANGNPINTPLCTINNASLNQPSGVFIDTVTIANPPPASGTDIDFLYVTNRGNHTVLTLLLEFPDPFPVRPASIPCPIINSSRVISSSTTFPSEDQLNVPIAPFVDMNSDRLFLLNWGGNSIFSFDKASTRVGNVRPDKNIVGNNTRLEFSHPAPSFPVNFTGALLFNGLGNAETLFVGQPVGAPFNGQPIGTSKDTTCDPVTGSPLNCPRGALLVFGTEGKVRPSRIFSGGDAALSTPAAIALDTQRDTLYIADQGDKTVTGDDAISIITEASTLDSNVSSTSPNFVKIMNADLTAPLNNPAGLFIDETNNRLYIANSGGIVKLTGTLSVTNDSTVVTGTGFTDPSINLRPGDIINIKDIVNKKNVSVVVAKITSDTELSLLTRWFAPTNPAAEGFVVRCSMATPCNVLVFDAGLLGQGTSGPFAPLQPITNNLALTAMDRPHGITIDPTTQTIYVANTGGDAVLKRGSVLIFNSDGTLKANLGGVGPDLLDPSKLIDTEISRPVDVAVDSSRDLLYVLNRLEQEILVFEGASQLTPTDPLDPSKRIDNIAPARVISGVNGGVVDAIINDTQLTLKDDYTGPTRRGMTYSFQEATFSETFLLPFVPGTIDVTNGLKPVMGTGTTFTDFKQRLEQCLLPDPTKECLTIQVGESLLAQPSALFLDEANDFLYVTDRIANAVYVFFNASKADDAADPKTDPDAVPVHKTLMGDNTGLRLPSAIAVDLN
ncbi:MAG: hypothetical protein ACE5HN_01300 [Nitrospiria bacterium]